MKPRKKYSQRVLSLTTTVAIFGIMSFAYQNCAKTQFRIDPFAKSEALGKESVFGHNAGDDGSIPGVSPGDDGSIPGASPGDDGNVAGGGTTPGNDGSIPGGGVSGNDPSVPGGTSTGNDPSMPGFPTSGNDPYFPRWPSTGNDPSIPGFPTSGNDPSMPGFPTSGNDPSIPGFPTSGNDPSIPGGTSTGNDTAVSNVTVGFSYVCSNMQTNAAKGNVLSASALKIVIVNQMNQVACELSGDFKSQILNTKKVSFTPCANLPAGSYEAYIMDVAAPSSSFLFRAFTHGSIDFTKNSNGSYYVRTSKVEILYDLNNQQSLYGNYNSQYGNTSTSATQSRCDSRASPLIVSMSSDAKGISLTSPLAGIQFDILGDKSFPMAHDKKQISWLASGDQEYYFIVLPNKNGQVLGINEMFGDNTKGPDGRFAANGYAALAKYDDTKDGLITEEDLVYGNLRLWLDKNRNGIAEADELYSLKDKGVTVIDLHYDKNYKEVDQYGNQTLMKSVIKTEDGKLHLLFDLWFRYLNITK